MPDTWSWDIIISYRRVVWHDKHKWAYYRALGDPSYWCVGWGSNLIYNYLLLSMLQVHVRFKPNMHFHIPKLFLNLCIITSCHTQYSKEILTAMRVMVSIGSRGSHIPAMTPRRLFKQSIFFFIYPTICVLYQNETNWTHLITLSL